MKLFKVVDEAGNELDHNFVNQEICKVLKAKHLHDHYVKSWDVNIGRVMALTENNTWSKLKEYWDTGSTYWDTVIAPVVEVFRDKGWKIMKHDRHRDSELLDSEKGESH